ncbi:MAG: hypothetical protein JSW39_09205, partial [Desulfobacterales bacterium]
SLQVQGSEAETIKYQPRDTLACNWPPRVGENNENSRLQTAKAGHPSLKAFDLNNTPPSGLNLIEASAGTGKKYAIEGLSSG